MWGCLPCIAVNMFTHLKKTKTQTAQLQSFILNKVFRWNNFMSRFWVSHGQNDCMFNINAMARCCDVDNRTHHWTNKNKSWVGRFVQFSVGLRPTERKCFLFFTVVKKLVQEWDEYHLQWDFSGIVPVTSWALKMGSKGFWAVSILPAVDKSLALIKLTTSQSTTKSYIQTDF